MQRTGTLPLSGCRSLTSKGDKCRHGRARGSVYCSVHRRRPVPLGLDWMPALVSDAEYVESQSPEPLLPLNFPDEIVERYTQGECAFLAKALRELLGGELWVLTDKRRSDNCHTLLCCELQQCERFVDITGVYTRDSAFNRYRESHCGVELIPVAKLRHAHRREALSCSLDRDLQLRGRPVNMYDSLSDSFVDDAREWAAKVASLVV